VIYHSAKTISNVAEDDEMMGVRNENDLQSYHPGLWKIVSFSSMVS